MWVYPQCKLSLLSGQPKREEVLTTVKVYIIPVCQLPSPIYPPLFLSRDVTYSNTNPSGSRRWWTHVSRDEWPYLHRPRRKEREGDILDDGEGNPPSPYLVLRNKDPGIERQLFSGNVKLIEKDTTDPLPFTPVSVETIYCSRRGEK